MREKRRTTLGATDWLATMLGSYSEAARERLENRAEARRLPQDFETCQREVLREGREYRLYLHRPQYFTL